MKKIEYMFMFLERI